MENRKVKEKLMDINDRLPSYKLYTYEGYDPSNSRFRAQAKLLDKLKLHEKCQQTPGTIVVDVGASLGSIICVFICSSQMMFTFRSIQFLCCSVWMSSLYGRSRSDQDLSH